MLRGKFTAGVLASAALAFSAFAITATSAGAAQVALLPLPTTPAGETSNPTLENDRADYHRYLNEANASLLVLESRRGSGPPSKCREAVKSEDLALIARLVEVVHPQIVTLKTELAEAGSLNASLLKEVGVELEAASNVVQGAHARAKVCAKAEATSVAAPGAEGIGVIVEILKGKYEKTIEEYEWSFVNLSKAIERHAKPAVIEIQVKLDRNMNKLIFCHPTLEALEAELAADGTLNPLAVKEVRAVIETAEAGVAEAQAEINKLAH